MILKYAKHFAALALLAGSVATCGAQSHDLKKPMPLGPGINKGNVDNKENGPNYYYFYAGPGHVQLHYAFKEMGVLGNPLRQALSFDLYDENNKLLSHDAIVSLEKMETASRPGDLASRHKLTLRVIAPDTVLRLGGYYEIEVTGAATFEGKTAGANVNPKTTELYHPVGPLATPAQGANGANLSGGGASLYTPQGSLSTPQGSLSTPQGSLSTPQGSLSTPQGSLSTPQGSLSTPQGSLYTPGASLYTPGQSLYTPVGALTNVQESPKELRLTLAADILFDFDKATIRPDARVALDRVAEIIRSKSHGAISIEGFTDSKGAADYNLRLSNARAESVQTWLVEREGLPGGGLTTRGFGATRFVAPNTKPGGGDDPAGRQKNRRVEVVISKRN